MEKIRVSELAEKLNSTKDEVISRLKLAGIEVTASSKLDELTILKATLLMLDHPRVEEIAGVLKLSTDKVLSKLSEAGATVISHLSIVNQSDLIRFLKLDDFNIQKNSPKKKPVKRTKVKKKKSLKQKRVFEVAKEIGVSEKALMHQLQEMHAFATHRRSPLDDETIKSVRQVFKERKSKVNRFKRFSLIFLNFLKNAGIAIRNQRTGLIAASALCALFIIFNSIYTYKTASNYPFWKLAGITIPEPEKTPETMKTIGLLNLSKADQQISISSEGAYVSELAPALTHLKASPVPGSQGVSILTDPKGDTYETLKELVPGDILIVRLLNESRFYYKVTAGKELDRVMALPLRSGLLIKVRHSGKTMQVKAILQKTD